MDGAVLVSTASFLKPRSYDFPLESSFSILLSNPRLNSFLNATVPTLRVGLFQAFNFGLNGIDLCARKHLAMSIIAQTARVAPRYSLVA
jgi:hypothetical protein